MSKLKALILPAAASLEKVCPPTVRALIENYFEARFNLSGAEYTKAEQDALLGDADVLLTTWGSPVLDLDSLGLARSLKYIGHAAGTVKARLPFEAFERGVRVFSAAGRIAESVADWCLAAIMSMLRAFPLYDGSMHGGMHGGMRGGVGSGANGEAQSAFSDSDLWGVGASAGVKGSELAGMEVGIVSLSSTARALLLLLAPFRCDILAYDPYVSQEQAQELGVSLGSLEDVMSRQVVSIHLPVLPATKGMITRDMFKRMPDGGLFINSARASVIDGDALIDELSSGRIRAALDVYDTEPLPLDSPLRKLPNVLLTPHIAGATVQSHQALMRCIVEDIINAIEGNPTRYEIDPARWDILA